MRCYRLRDELDMKDFTRKMVFSKQNCVPIDVFNDYNGQQHVSACTDHYSFFLSRTTLKILSSPYSIRR